MPGSIKDTAELKAAKETRIKNKAEAKKLKGMPKKATGRVSKNNDGPAVGVSSGLANTIGKIIIPAINEAKKKQNCFLEGPISADTAFSSERRKDYDVAICMYHDQALIPIKTLDFFNGVNVTLGLDFIRTSPDHGTGFDLSLIHI